MLEWTDDLTKDGPEEASFTNSEEQIVRETPALLKRSVVALLCIWEITVWTAGSELVPLTTIVIMGPRVAETKQCQHIIKDKVGMVHILHSAARAVIRRE